MRYVVVTAAVVLAACGRLPRELRSEIESENGHLQSARRQMDKSRDAVRTAAAPNDWTSRLRADDDRLSAAERTRKDLEREGSPDRARRLLSEERRLRQTAEDDARAVEKDALHWIDVQRNLPRYVAKVREPVDLAAAEKVVEKAGQDWPAKKSDLESRFALLKQKRESAESRLQASGDKDVAAVVELENASPAALQQQAGQLYDAWDRILEDLDDNHGTYREKLKTVKTHFVDVPAKKTEVSSDEKWVEVPEPDYRSVEKDLGMAISHKDAGLYDSEAKNLAQPPGYAYIAPPGVESNQYGYWSHTSSGSFWTFLPQYLIMRELLWGRNYQPVVINDYNRYYQAQRAGRSYYGVEAPGAPPKYGTHGTFTQQKYASSRYVQSGGFRSSGYSSNRDTIAPQGKRFGYSGSDPSVGKRFGSPAQGKRFGAPSSGGRRFGGRRR